MKVVRKTVESTWVMLFVFASLLLPGESKAQGWFGIDDPTVRPYRYIGKIMTIWPNGQRSFGTGVLIGRSHVLTAAHNLYNREMGQYASMVTFYPGLHMDRTPFLSANATKVCVPNLYRSGSQWNDAGVFRINRPLGDRTGGWMILDEWVLGRDYYLQGGGYIGAFMNGLWQTRAYGEFTRLPKIHELAIYSNVIPPQPGASGGPLYEYMNGSWHVRGVIVGGHPFVSGTTGVRLLWGFVKSFREWIARNP